MHSTQLFGKKYHATAAALDVIHVNMAVIPWSWFRRIRDNDRGRCDKRGRKHVKRRWDRGEAWELTWAEKKLRNAEHNNSDIRKNQDLWYWYAPHCSNILTVMQTVHELMTLLPLHWANITLHLDLVYVVILLMVLVLKKGSYWFYMDLQGNIYVHVI